MEGRQVTVDGEVHSAEEVGPLVKKYGVAIWRGLVPTDIAGRVIEPVLANVGNEEAYVTRKYGVLDMGVLPEDLRRACVVPNMVSVYHQMLGGAVTVNGEVYFTAPDILPHAWHQDARAGDERYHALSWTAVMPCGIDQPGLSFALGNPGRYAGPEQEGLDGLDVISPVFQPGDTFFFDVFSFHKTNINPGMKYSRIAYKIIARPAAAYATSNPRGLN